MSKGSSVFKIKNGWRGYAVIGRKSDGDPVKKWVSGKTKAEVQQKLELIKPVDATQLITQDFDITVSEWLERFTLQRARSVRPKTTQLHQGYCRYINANLGGIKLRELNRFEVQTLYNQLQDRGLSNSVRTHVHHFLKAALNEARDSGLMTHLPIGKVPKTHTEPVSKTWSIKEIKAFLQVAKARSPYYPIYFVLLDTGLRLGEALALQWKHYDDSRITVERTLSIVHGLPTFNPPKTMRGYRTFDASQSTCILLNTIIGEPEDLIFSSRNKEPIDISSVRRSFNGIIKRAGVKKIRIHDMRHTFITRAREKGVPVEVVAAMVGQDVKVTLDIYSQVSDQRKKWAREQLGELLEEE